ncbi:MAG: hypothetical protein KJ067_11725 [Vicinamibacteria bacterium]|nr:hypothetical protein [Vicinamibacteria bacterium]
MDQQPGLTAPPRPFLTGAVGLALALLTGCGGASGPGSPAGSAATPTPTPAPTPIAPAPQPIRNIVEFLERCPQEDPAYERIRFDLEIRRNGTLVTDIPCTGIASALPTEQFTDELIALQNFRVLYHMDAGLVNHLPWTDKRAYEWFASKIGGVNIRDTPGVSCCSQFGSRFFVNIPVGSEADRDFARGWLASASIVATLLHEARHRDGFTHSSCCGVPAGCDETYDESNLSAYGVHYWSMSAWLMGTINVGIGCQGRRDIQEWGGILHNTINGLARRFCTRAPEAVPYPTNLGGPCLND